jgi:uncharacterized phage protein (TIGR02218 family)
MSQVIPITLAAHHLLRCTTLAACLKVVRRDGMTLGLTSAAKKFDFDGTTYYPGFTPSDSTQSSGLDVENLEVTVIPGTTLLTQVELAAGLWDNAQFSIFDVNHQDLTQGQTPSRRGRTGEAQLNDNSMWTIEFRGLKQALQQSLGAVTSKTCIAKLGDNRCKVNLIPHTFALTVTGVTSKQVFTASAATQASEWFKEGSVEFTSGPNANPAYAQKVKVFESGVFTLVIPMWFDITIGDTFNAITGCQKRHERTSANPSGISDCIAKFSNILNFQGEPHLGGLDGLTALPVNE